MMKKRYIIIGIILLFFLPFVLNYVSEKRIETILDGAERYKLLKELQGDDIKYSLSGESAFVPIGEYVAKYDLVKNSLNRNISSNVLKERKADLVAETIDVTTGYNYKWYSIKERDGIRYLIRETEGLTNTLWTFVSFVENPDESVEKLFPDAVYDFYTYNSALEQIYDVEDASDIKCILISRIYDVPHIFLWEKLITDEEEIEKIHTIISQMNYCLDKNFYVNGVTNYDQEVHLYSGYLEYAPEMYLGYASNELEEEAKEIGIKACVEKYHRVLTIVLNDGTTIDNLHYTASAGAFYDYVQYEKLDAEYVEVLNSLFGIK